MAQPPLIVDALEIKGDATTGTRTVAANAADGSLFFSDAKITAGLRLDQLPGLQQVENVFLVGKSGAGVGKDGAGVSFNTIQAAIDAVPNSFTLQNPALILVSPGQYQENVTLNKDGLVLQGLGGVVIQNVGAVNTVTVVAAVGTPIGSQIRDLRIENDQDNLACVQITGGSGSIVGQDGITIYNCDLIATGLSGLQVKADIVNTVRVLGGTWVGSSSSSLCQVDQVANFEVRDVAAAWRFLLSYDNGGTKPFLTSSAYQIWSTEIKGLLTTVLTSAGSLDVRNSKVGSTTSCNGTESQRFDSCELNAVVVNDTAAVKFVGGTRGALSGSGTASFAESLFNGNVSYTAETSKSVAFDVPRPNANYTVALDSELVPTSFNEVPTPISKTTAGFDIDFPSAVTTTVFFTVSERL